MRHRYFLPDVVAAVNEPDAPPDSLSPKHGRIGVSPGQQNC
jgi:hypothetical protein